MSLSSKIAPSPSVAPKQILAMYEKFFGLQRIPFKMVPDADCLHMTGQHADVISGAVFAMLERKGFVVLTGEAGLGKTTAIRAVTEMLTASKAHTSIISHPTLNASDFLELAMLNFGLPEVSASKAQRIKMLEAFLLEADAQGRVCVLIVDEAHQLPPEALEEIRLLGNFESANHKLLQILLVGQNELNARLNLSELWQLKQRVAYRLTLERLDPEGVENYIQFRWTYAGGSKHPFDSDALAAIAKWSQGTPRVINAICDNALMLALSESTRVIGLPQIQVICEDLHLPMPALPRRQAQNAGAVAPVRTDLPQLVRAAAAARGGAPQSQVNSKAAHSKGSTAAKPQPSAHPEKPSQPALAVKEQANTATEGWSLSRPWLMKKWRGFLDGQKTTATHHSDMLSIKRRQ